MGQLAPPPPTTGRTLREIDADPRRFSCRKNGGRFTGFAPTFYMNRRYGGRSLVLRAGALWQIFQSWHCTS